MKLGDQPGGRGRPDHPHLRDTQPAQARPAGRRGHAQPLTAVAADPAGSGGGISGAGPLLHHRARARRSGELRCDAYRRL
jgi:hypothetical protein